MTTFSKKDLKFSLLTGVLTGFMAWKVLDSLGVPSIWSESQGSWAWLIAIVPFIFIFGTWLGYFLGQWFKFFDQFGKFSVIGFTNAAMDFGVLNFLIVHTGYDAGWWYTMFKGSSFIIASFASYLWNKYWAFNAGNTRGGGVEFGKFFAVAILGLIINNGVASSVVNFIEPLGKLDTHAWANIGAVAGAAISLIATFTGYKLAVFRK